MLWLRFGYDIIVNGLYAVLRKLGVDGEVSKAPNSAVQRQSKNRKAARWNRAVETSRFYSGSSLHGDGNFLCHALTG